MTLPIRSKMSGKGYVQAKLWSKTVYCFKNCTFFFIQLKKESTQISLKNAEFTKKRNVNDNQRLRMLTGPFAEIVLKPFTNLKQVWLSIQYIFINGAILKVPQEKFIISCSTAKTKTSVFRYFLVLIYLTNLS